jgi:predicted GTPase
MRKLKPVVVKWRLIVLAALFLVPFVFLLGAGGWWLYEKDWWFIAWWPLAGCLAAAYLLAWWWQRRSRLLPGPDYSVPLHWTDRDQRAWQLVEARAKAVKEIPPSRFVEIPFYVTLAQDMALELARFYHPRAKDPVGSLTIPEILAVVELAAHDLADLVDDYLPGGHMLTINQWRNASKVGDWYSRVSNVYWAVSAIFSPLNTAARYAASRLGLSRPLQMLQENVLAWFYMNFVHRVGTYLIDLNSGRLRVGARRYRELVAQARAVEAVTEQVAPTPPAEPGVVITASEVVLTLLGQVKAGKSSLVNAFLGEQRAGTDVLPLTDEITRYQLQPQGISSRLILLDTVGYAHQGPKADKLRATQAAVQQSDLVLLVLHARDPARQPDLELLQALRDWFQARENLKMPRILGVLTHIDLLSPLMEWTPPYNWLQPQRPKEKSIHDAVAAVEEQLGKYLVGVVPVCVAEGKVYGVQEWLLPRIVELLDEARAVALLRCLQAEADTGKIRKVLDQLLQAGKQLLRVAFQEPVAGRPP